MALGDANVNKLIVTVMIARNLLEIIEHETLPGLEALRHFDGVYSTELEELVSSLEAKLIDYTSESFIEAVIDTSKSLGIEDDRVPLVKP